MGRGIRRMRRWVAIGLSCVLVAGLVPAASFAQGASAVDAVRESLQLDANDAVASDAAVAVGDSDGGAVSGGVLVAGLEATAAGEEGSAAAAAGENGATGASSATEETAAGIGVGDADVAAPVGGIAASAVRSADEGDDSDSGSDGGSAPDYDGTEASYAYDEYYEQWFLVTAKGVTGEKVEDDGGYVAGAKTPAQAWLTLDEDTGDLAVHHVDAGATAFEVPATVDGRPIVKVGGCGSEGLTSVAFPADSRVRAFEWGAFAGSGIASIALPESLEDLGQAAFSGCKKLQTVAWPKNNDMLKTIPEQAFSGCSMLDDSVVATIPASVETIDYQAFSGCAPGNIIEGETPEPFTDIVIPGTVKTVERYAFYQCYRVRSIIIGAGVETIGNNAFSPMPLMAGAEVVLPSSVRSVGEDAFENTQITSRPGGAIEWNRNAVMLRVLNPDFELEEYEYGGTLEIDGKKYANPFSVGQTIVAFAKNSAGQPSWIKRMADAVAGQEDEYNPGKPAYTFEWMEEQAQVAGKVPVGARVTLTQLGTTTQADVSADGTFALPAETGVAASVTVALDGYYDYVLSRAGAEMMGAWNIGEIAEADLTKVPASRLMRADVRQQVSYGDAGAGGAAGEGTYSGLTSDEGLTFELRAGDRVLEEGEDRDYVRSGFTFAVSQEIADADSELTLTVTPAQSMRLAAATVTAKPSDGAFDVKLARWGAVRVQASCAAASGAQVLLFHEGRCVADSTTAPSDVTAGYDPVWTYDSAALAAGDYDVVAIAVGDVDVHPSTWAAFERFGLAGGSQYGKASVRVEDGVCAQVSLKAPDFDLAALAAGVGIEATMQADDALVAKGVETGFTLAYRVPENKQVTLHFDMPESMFGNVSVGVDAGDVRYALDSWRVSREGDVLSVDLSNVADAQEGRLFVRYTPQVAGSRHIAVNASMAGAAGMMPLGSVVCNVANVFIQDCEQTLGKLEGNTATVAATPGADVVLAVGDQEFSATANGLGRATVTYDLPVDTKAGATVELRARLAGDDADAFADSLTVQYLPSSSIHQFKVTNNGKTQVLVRDGATQANAYLVVAYQLPIRANAYWSFDVTMDVTGQMAQDAEAADALELFVTCEDGRCEVVPLAKKSQMGSLVRYVGEFVDEAYLVLYEQHKDKLRVPTGTGAGLFLPQCYQLDGYAVAGGVQVDEAAATKDGQDASQQAKGQLDDYFVQMSESVDDSFRKTDARVSQMISGWLDVARASGDEVAVKAVEQLRDAMPSTTDLREGGEAFGYDMSDMIFANEAAVGRETFTGDPTAGLDEVLEGEDLEQARAALTTMQRELVSLKANFATVRSAPGGALNVGDLSAYSSWDDVMMAALGNGFTASPAAGQPSGFTSLGESGGVAGSYSADEAGGEYHGFTTVTVPTGSQVATFAAREGGEETGTRLAVDFSKYASYDPTGNADGNLTLATELNAANYLSGCVDASITSLDHLLLTVDSRGYLTISPWFINLVGRGDAVGLQNLFVDISSWWAVEKAIPDVSTKWGTLAGGGKLSRGTVIGGAFGVATGMMGAQDAANGWLESKAQVETLDGDISVLKQWIAYYEQRNPCDSDCASCLAALRRELKAAEAYRDCLWWQNAHNCTDMWTGATVTAVGLAASLSGRKDVESATNVAGFAYDVTSTSLHLARAPRLASLKSAYEAAHQFTLFACKELDRSNKGKSEEEKKADEQAWKDATLAKYMREIRLKKQLAQLVIDPSGYVYEGMASNRLEGVTATLYEADEASGAGAAKWDAAWFGQANDQVTGADGVFAWDTPSGWYQVRFAKEGYRDATSADADGAAGGQAWLSVPPIRDNVAVGMVSTAAPQVSAARAYGDYVELEFSQYMQVDAALSAVGIDDATFEWADVQEAPDGTRLARVLHMHPGTGFAEGSMVEFSLDGAVNYAGTPLGVWASGPLEVAKRPAKLAANYEANVCLMVEQPVGVTVHVTYADGSPVVGQAVSATLDSAVVAQLGSGAGAGGSRLLSVTDDAGVATFPLFADVPGFAELTLAAEGTTLSKTLDVRAAMDAAQPARPVAQLGDAVFDASSPKVNKVTVAKGTQLVLTCATEGAELYYTTDDTCPCKPEGSRVRYTGPVTVTENTLFRIAAYKEGMAWDEYSERLNLEVTVVDDGEEPGPGPVGPGEPTDPGKPGGPDAPQPGGSDGEAGGDAGSGGGANDGGAGGGVVGDVAGNPAGQQAAKATAFAATGDVTASTALPLAVFAVVAIAVATLAFARLRARRSQRRK